MTQIQEVAHAASIAVRRCARSRRANFLLDDARGAPSWVAVSSPSSWSSSFSSITNLRMFSTRAKRSFTRSTSSPISVVDLAAAAPATRRWCRQAALLRPLADGVEVDLDQRRDEVAAVAEQRSPRDVEGCPSARSRSRRRDVLAAAGDDDRLLAVDDLHLAGGLVELDDVAGARASRPAKARARGVLVVQVALEDDRRRATAARRPAPAAVRHAGSGGPHQPSRDCARALANGWRRRSRSGRRSGRPASRGRRKNSSDSGETEAPPVIATQVRSRPMLAQQVAEQRDSQQPGARERVAQSWPACRRWRSRAARSAVATAIARSKTRQRRSAGRRATRIRISCCSFSQMRGTPKKKRGADLAHVVRDGVDRLGEVDDAAVAPDACTGRDSRSATWHSGR